jgi:hypothetical protein
MMYWFWLNTPLAAAFFAAWAGIPLWLVCKHADAGPHTASADRREHASDNWPRTPDRMLVQ